MYQFYYAQGNAPRREPCKLNMQAHFQVRAIRPTMWEEHCLECAAPVCFGNCVHYAARTDGRCKRFANGMQEFSDPLACCGHGVRVKFRKWGNMMTVLFPAMLEPDAYAALWEKNGKKGHRLSRLVNGKLPLTVRWNGVRTVEYLRRRKLRKLPQTDNLPDAFLFQAYSYMPETFRLILEIYDSHTPVFKTAISVQPGENLQILSGTQLSEECAKPGRLVKLYPENDLEAEMDIYWCDFVKGSPLAEEKPAAQVKCVVWDLDNTLWDGILIETEDPQQLRLRKDVLATVQALDERGVVQSVASKNDHEAAWPVVERLGLGEYFLYPQIHWNAKSTSLKQIASSLNIGLDSLALVDDSVFERAQVQSACPQVRVYDENQLLQMLQLPEFDLSVTQESRKRRQMYRAEEKRNNLKASDNSDTVSFLKKCNLRIRIFTPEGEQERLRCYELVVRTNQLNMSGKKYTPEEFEQVLHREGHKSFAFSCADDFGEYGIVGFGQYRIEAGVLIFTEFAMSCRVAGKYVESALFTELLRREGCKSGRFCVVKTTKNILLRNTLQEIGFREERSDQQRITYYFDDNLKHCNLVYCQ